MKKLMWISVLAMLLAMTTGARARGRTVHSGSLHAGDREVAKERAREVRRERKSKQSPHHAARRHGAR